MEISLGNRHMLNKRDNDVQCLLSSNLVSKKIKTDLGVVSLYIWRSEPCCVGSGINILINYVGVLNNG